MDLVIEDGSRVSTVYFLMSEDNVRRQLKLPWVSFGSDEGSLAPQGIFLKANPHPRAYVGGRSLIGLHREDAHRVFDALERALAAVLERHAGRGPRQVAHRR